MELTNSNDHWAFLEEIEAPMWVDLSLEAKSANQDIDDDWFRITHPFHQCSAIDLKAAFAESDNRSLSSDFEIQRQPTPKIPSSVSRSRGKHCKSKKLRGEDDHLLTHQHQVKALHGRSFYGKSGSWKEIKHQNRISVPKHVFTGKINEKGPRTSHKEGSENSSLTDKAGDSNLSTITSESSCESQKKITEVSSQALGNTSRLLSTKRFSLRRSHVTRQASRVEINKDKCLSGDRKFSSGKSSVGSCHTTCYDVKRSATGLMQSKERTTDSRNARIITKEAENKPKASNISKTSNVQVNFTRNTAKLVHQEVSKSKKFQNRSLHSKVALLDKINGRNSLTSTAKDKQKDKITKKDLLISIAKDKKKVRKIGVGKENSTEKMREIQNCSSRSIAYSKDRNTKFVGVKAIHYGGLIPPRGWYNVHLSHKGRG